MWPNAKISVMGGDQAAGVLTTVKAAAAKKAGTPLAEDEMRTYHERIAAQYDGEMQSYFSTARLWDDGIIEPTQTRSVLSLSLSAAANAPLPVTKAGVFRM